MKNIRNPILSFEWQITDKCNYKCSYCFLEKSKHLGDSSDKTINAVFKLLPMLKKSWLVKLTGGEPLNHPSFLKICEKVIHYGHRLCLTTNFSSPLDKFQKLIDICGDKLDFVTASLHIDQIKSIDKFIGDSVRFNSKKNPHTNFHITAVLTKGSFNNLKRAEKIFKNKNIPFSSLPLKNNGMYYRYNDEIEKYIHDKSTGNIESIRNNNFFGNICYCGKYFFRINIAGDVFRCYNYQPLYYYLGSLMDNTFKRLNKPKLCFAQKCSCAVPANRNMIQYKNKVPTQVVLDELIKYRKKQKS